MLKTKTPDKVRAIKRDLPLMPMNSTGKDEMEAAPMRVIGRIMDGANYDSRESERRTLDTRGDS